MSYGRDAWQYITGDITDMNNPLNRVFPKVLDIRGHSHVQVHILSLLRVLELKGTDTLPTPSSVYKHVTEAPCLCQCDATLWHWEFHRYLLIRVSARQQLHPWGF